jgi:hypothetical protein
VTIGLVRPVVDDATPEDTQELVLALTSEKGIWTTVLRAHITVHVVVRMVVAVVTITSDGDGGGGGGTHIALVFTFRFLLGLRFGARYVHRIGSHQQSNRIRDWLEQLRVRPGNHFSYFPRVHHGHRCEGGDCAHKTCDLLARRKNSF